MTVTGGTLTEKVEKMLESLTPVEKARFMSGERWRLADEYAAGNDVTAQEQDLKTIASRYVNPMGAGDFIRYIQELNDLEIREWGSRFFCNYIAGLEREAALIDLIILEKNRAWLNAMKKPEEINRDIITVLEGRKHTIQKEIKTLHAADF